jgi:hypothetical protein
MIVVDEQLIGWKDHHEAEFKLRFGEIRTIGQHPQLPKGIKDKNLAAYCKQEASPLLTCDRTVYADFFVNTGDTVSIRLFGTNDDSGQIIYELSITGVR